MGVRAGRRRGAARLGNLKVVTTNLRAGYVRRNGAPHSDKRCRHRILRSNTLANGDAWLTITTKVEDPVYFTRPHITTTDFKKLPTPGWNPTPCSAGRSLALASRSVPFESFESLRTASALRRSVSAGLESRQQRFGRRRRGRGGRRRPLHAVHGLDQQEHAEGDDEEADDMLTKTP